MMCQNKTTSYPTCFAAILVCFSSDQRTSYNALLELSFVLLSRQKSNFWRFLTPKYDLDLLSVRHIDVNSLAAADSFFSSELFW